MSNKKTQVPDENNSNISKENILWRYMLFFSAFLVGLFIGPAAGFLACISILECTGHIWLGVIIGIACQAAFSFISYKLWRFETETIRPNTDFNQTSSEVFETHGLSLLQKAAENGEIETLIKLLAFSHDVNHQEEEYGYSPLHLASAEGHLNAVQLLLESGANPNLRDFEGYTPLHLASSQGKSEIISVLLAHGANVDSQSNDGSTPMHLAALERHESAVIGLLQGGATVDLPDEESRTPLHMAVFWLTDEKPTIVETLLKHGANPLWTDRFGKTPISRAEQNTYEISLRLLLSASIR